MLKTLTCTLQVRLVTVVTFADCKVTCPISQLVYCLALRVEALAFRF